MLIKIIQNNVRFVKKNKSLFLDRTPSLIHGDLWSGNIGTDIHNKPRLLIHLFTMVIMKQILQ